MSSGRGDGWPAAEPPVFFKDVQSFMHNIMGELSRMRTTIERDEQTQQEMTARIQKVLQNERYETRELTNKFRYEFDELVHTRVKTVLDGLEDMEQCQKNKDRLQQQQLDGLEKDMSNLKSSLVGVNSTWVRLKSNYEDRADLTNSEFLPSEKVRLAQGARKSEQLNFETLGVATEQMYHEKSARASIRARCNLIKERQALERVYSVVEILRMRLKAAAMSIGGVDWERLFRKYDEDGSGKMSEYEFRTMVRKCLHLGDESDSELSLIFQSLDANGSGQVEIDELVLFVSDPALRMRNRLRAAVDEYGHDWKLLLKQIDDDGSGQIDFPEFHKMCRTHLKILDNELHLRSLFASLDADSSGEVSIEELVAWVDNPEASPTRRADSDGFGRGVNFGQG